jgi:regulator of protease activity HflC (stomatin/prohibitin superfamily)
MLFLGGCGWAVPDAGHEAVLVKKPLIFGSGGVDKEPLKTGRHLIAVTTEPVYINMRPLQYTVHFEDLMSSDGVPLDFDAVIRLKVLDSVKLFENFGAEFYEANIEKEFSERLRQAVRKHGMNETAIDTNAIEEIDDEVTESMRTYIKEAGIPVELIQVTVGKANPPDSIKSQRVETAAQQQRQNTERERKLAEDQRMEAEKSRAKADNAYRESMQLSPGQFLQLEQIKMLNEVCSGGKCTFLMGTGASPIVPVK